MRILVDISHPSHVHFFRNAIALWRDHGHELHIISRRKDIILELLSGYGLSNTCLSTAGKGMPGLLRELFLHNGRLYREARAFQPDIMLQVGGIFVSHVGFALRIPAVAFTDTEMDRLCNAVTFPVADAVVTPSCYNGPAPPARHYLYPGYHELAYLHPNRFTPDPAVLRSLGLEPGERFFIVRFVSWGAAHDVGESGFERSARIEMVRELSGRGRVFITSEGELPDVLEKYRYPMKPEMIHHALAFAGLFIGESSTMASEAAVLGVPAIFVSTSPRGYTTELERVYGMAFTFSHKRQGEALEKMRELLAMDDLREVWAEKRKKLLADKIDVTDWLVRLVEEYPGSLKTLCLRPADIKRSA